MSRKNVPNTQYVEWTVEAENEILSRLIDGEPLKEICRTAGLPAESSVRKKALLDKEFGEKYSRAREIGYLHMADELLSISDDGSNDWMESNSPEGTGWKFNSEHVQRSRLRVDTRKWFLTKMLPKVFGDKVTNEHTGPGGGAVPVSIAVSFVKPGAE